jgi:hypothetical protein
MGIGQIIFIGFVGLLLVIAIWRNVVKKKPADKTETKA